MFHPDMMTDTLAPRGYKANFDFDKYVLSIVKNEMSYGAAQGFYEISIFENDNQIELPGITDEGDAVKGWLTIEDVNSIIKKLTTITGVNAKLL